MSDEAKTFPMTLAGREIIFRAPGLGQVIMLQRLAGKSIKAATDAPEGDEGLQQVLLGYSRVLDFIETLIVSPDDRIFVEEQTLAGNIEFADLMKALAGGKQDPDTPDDETPAPLKRTPRKSAAKTVGTRGRTKR
jgi:hypothetical protein